MNLPSSADESPRGVGSRLAVLVRGEAFPGILLVLCAAIALVAANLPWHAAWTGIWHAPLTLGAEPDTQVPCPTTRSATFSA